MYYESSEGKTLPTRSGVRLLMSHPTYSLPSGVSVASEARPIIAFYSRFRDICIYIIYIYMSVCTCIAQDHGHLTQVLSRRPLCIWNTGCYSEHDFGVALSLGMADGASSAEDSPDDDSDFSRTCTTTRHRKRPDDDSDLGRTRTATGQKKHSLISQTAAQREERLAVERLQHIPFFITSSYYTCTLPYTSFSLLYVFKLSPILSLLLLIYQIHKLLHD